MEGMATDIHNGYARGHCYFNRSRVSKVRATRIEQENRSHVRVRKRGTGYDYNFKNDKWSSER